MKKSALIIVLILCGLKTYSQSDSTLTTDSNEVDKKYIAWISPSHATHVYGLMFNYWPRNDGYKYSKYPKINGVELNVMPLGIFLPFILAVHSLGPETHKPPVEKIESIDFKSFKKINGIQIGLINMEPTIINGLDINAAGSFESKTNGVTISVVMNKHYFVNGLTIGTIGNHDTKCNGVQIGLINSCKQLKGFQIGLWNKNQKRSLPIINWCFKKL